jgi:hypothetical protein
MVKNIKQVIDELREFCGPEYTIRPATGAAARGLYGIFAEKAGHSALYGFGSTWEAAAESLIEALTT